MLLAAENILHLLVVLSSFGKDFVVVVALDLYVVAGDFFVFIVLKLWKRVGSDFFGISQAFTALDLVERTVRS